MYTFQIWPDNVMTCSLCLQGYRGASAKRNLTSHMIKVHKIGQPRFRCVCGEAFVWDGQFYLHKKTCTHHSNKVGSSNSENGD